MVRDTVWQSEELATLFINEVRGGIPFAAEQLEIMLRALGLAQRPIERFLDLGCGDGTVARAVLSRHANADAVLVDFSDPMLEAAREQLPDATIKRADFGSPDWVKAVDGLRPFDAVVSGYAIHHQSDERKRTLYREIFDLLAPGGVFINVEHVAPASERVAALSDEIFIDSLAAHNARMGLTKKREEIAAEYVHRPDKAANILATVGEQLDWLRAIGFEDVDCFFRVFELAVFGGCRP